jgi:Ca2+-binding EF-hand superfamily protein
MNDFQAEEEVDKIMKSVDKNNSGAIDYTGILDRNAIKN